MAELNTLIRKRSQQKGFLTRCEKFLANINVQAITEQTVEEIKLRRDKLSETFEAFSNIQNQIELSSEGLEIEGDDEREEFESRYYHITSQFQVLIHGSSSDAGSAHSEDSIIPKQNINTNSTQAFNAMMCTQTQLPLLKLPTFNGEYSEWLEFRDGFEALVDKNPILSDVQKLHHLRSCLGKEALATIQSISVTGSNYRLAFDTLKERYERNRLIIQSHIKAILHGQRPAKDSAKELRNFHNSIINNLQSLKNLGEPVDKWDTILITLITDKLDSATRREWEKYSTVHDSNSIKDLLHLINNRCEVLEKIDFNKESNSFQGNHKLISNSKIQFKNKIHHSSHVVTNSHPQRTCFYCKENHPLYYCSKFLNLSPTQRHSHVKKLGVCSNCLQSVHKTSECKSTFRCKKCGKLHNTLLHEDSTKSNSASQQNKTIPEVHLKTLANLNATVSQKKPAHSQILLSTAIVYVTDSNGRRHKCRALLDNGAMSNFITRNLKEKLGIKSTPINFAVTGVGQSALDTNSMIKINLMSQNSNYQKFIQCIVIDNITSEVPVKTFPKTTVKLPSDVNLADPQFYLSQPVDLLLGASIFWQILRSRKLKIPKTEVYLQETDLGWVLGGQLFIKQSTKKSINCLSTNRNLETLISKFWEIEEGLGNHPKQEINEECDTHFLKNTTRDEKGKFIVKIPFKENYIQLGQTRLQAEKRFLSIERKLIRNTSLYQEYIKFMEEYIDLGHMIPVSENNNKEELNYYIPHHAVVRENSLTTKLRVVFNASMKSDSGLSLNDVQYTGPQIQNELFSLLLNFRIHEYVMTADISKMYRMIWLHPDHSKFHRIFWRSSISQPIQCYELRTVTYGTASASYLAIRCLHQLANENYHKFPEACEIIKNNFYVDDLLCGANSEEELIQLQDQITTTLKGGGFELRKWLTNKKELHNHFNINHELECSVIILGEKETTTTLGVAWNASTDCIQYIHKPAKELSITKRRMLSELAQVFDPLGVLGPVIITGKIIIQSLWQEKIDWDSPVSQTLSQKWQVFREQLKQLNLISIPRHVILSNSNYVELHGFGDSSQKAYGAAIYLRSKSPNGLISSHLMCAKSRVAPLKQQTLPRLELCAAVLVAQLATKVQNSIKIKINKSYFWSDSTIVLSWIKSSPLRWKTFVSNRVGEIHRLTDQKDWHHVPTAENPADILSRGTTSDLSAHTLWWQGPAWLKTDSLPNQSISEESEEALQEAKKSINLTVQFKANEFITKFSNLTKLKRVFSYCIRFISNCRSTKVERKFGPLSAEEINTAFQKIIIIVQGEFYSKELRNLQRKIQIPSNSTLLSLNPFFHEDGLMRVGGRIKNSSCSFSKKHPIILPPRNHFTQLIFQYFHNLYFHCGPTQLLAAVREQFWPINGRNIAKNIVRNCKICFLAKPRPIQYQMGNLPGFRVNQCLPFSQVGIDYAGPFLLKDRSTRGAKLSKGYICLFICLATKAIHLEVVSDLTTSCFLSCLRRFISRRGKPSHIYSDNAKTFVGAKTEINNIYKFLKSNATDISDSLTKENINWHFIPPRAPNFGGIWEAGVKSVKHHLLRILGNTHLTFEQFNTILCQIECIINSRPLCPLTSNPDDVEPLTPGHFLIQKSPMSIPDGHDYLSINTNRLEKYQQLQQLCQHFWKRWHKEYLSQLQQRVKWKSGTTQEHLQPGTLVVIKEDQSPPLSWPLGRITEVHPGKDGVVRVVTLKINQKLIKRPVSKVCVLPNQKQ